MSNKSNSQANKIILFLKKKRIILFCIGVFLFSAIVYVSLHSPFSGGNLVIAHNDFVKNGGPLTILDLETGDTHKPDIPMMGCDGISTSAVQRMDLLVYCIGGEPDEAVWRINLKSFAVTPYKVSSSIYEKMKTPFHARLLMGSDGTEYYSSGGPTLIDYDWNATEAGVVIRKDVSVSHTYISDRKKTYFVFRMVLDEEEQKLWVMSMGDGEKVLIDRIDLGTKAIDFSTTILSYAGFDMILNGDDLVISTYRTKEGSDVFVFNKKSGEKIKEITLPVDEDRVLNALSMLVRNDILFISSTGGLFLFHPETYSVKEFVANNPEGYFTFLVQGIEEMYAISNFNTVVKIPDSDIREPTVLLRAEEGGLASLYFINK